MTPTRAWRWFICLAWVFTVGASSAADPRPQPRIERDPAFVLEVNAAIDRGVRWLTSREAGRAFRDHEWGGFEGGGPAFATYALRVCGVQRDDPMMQRCMESLKAVFYEQRSRGTLRNYTTALMCMAAAEPAPAPARASGTSDRGEPKLPAADLAWLRDMVHALELSQSPSGGWSYGDARANYDHSNTHFALLGLRAAARAGVRVRKSTWRQALEHLLAAQEPDGPAVPRHRVGPAGSTGAVAVDRARGWGYRAREPAYGSMTAGSVGAVAICREQLTTPPAAGGDGSAVVERSVADGIAWIGRYFSAESNPRAEAAPGWPTVYYWLYAVERAGILADVEWMADVDWYGRGARYLLGSQDASGQWPRVLPGGEPQRDALPATCCALLFLRRGTIPARRVPAALTGAAPIRFDGAAALGERDFQDLMDLVVARWTSVRLPSSRDALRAGCASVGARALGALVVRLGLPDLDARTASFELLHSLTGVVHGYAPDSPEGERRAAQDRWRTWLAENESRLRYDSAIGRFIAVR